MVLSDCGVGEDSESPFDCKEIQPVNPKGNQYSLEVLMLKLKLQYFVLLVCSSDSLEKTMMLGLMAGGKEGGIG